MFVNNLEREATLLITSELIENLVNICELISEINSKRKIRHLAYSAAGRQLWLLKGSVGRRAATVHCTK